MQLRWQNVLIQICPFCVDGSVSSTKDEQLYYLSFIFIFEVLFAKMWQALSLEASCGNYVFLFEQKNFYTHIRFSLSRTIKMNGKINTWEIFGSFSSSTCNFR